MVWQALSGATLAAGVIAIVLALALAAGIARSLSRPLTQMTRAVEGLSRGEVVAMPSDGGPEIAALAGALGELSHQLGTRQNLLENTVESIRDAVIVVDEHAVVVVANAAARRLLGIDRGFDSLTGPRKFACFLADGVTLLPIPDSPLARALRGENVDDFELVVQADAPAAPVLIVANARPLRDSHGQSSRRGDGAARRYRTKAGAPGAGRQRADGAVHRQDRARRLRPDRSRRHHPRLEPASRSPDRVDTRGGDRRQGGRSGVSGTRIALRTDSGSSDSSREVAAAPGGMRYEASSLHRDGHEFFVEVSLTALRRGDGYIINAFVRDITQKRLAEEQLIQAQKMESVGQLTGGIAHDFNNMLTVITGTIEILADGVKDTPHLATITKLISEAADRGAQLTADLLSFARKQPLQPAEIDVNGLIGEAVRLLSPVLGKQIEIETALSGDVWPAFVDRSQLSAALVNLAINARDAMPEGGKLTFATGNVTLGVPEAVARGVERAGDYVAIEVSDTGTGIAPSHLERIFDPFFSTKEVGRGTGLGLSMVFGFAKQSGGSVDVRSEEGRGTTFRIYLPKADSAARCSRRRTTTNCRRRAAVKPSCASRTTARSATM